MMLRFQNMPIRRKLTLIVLLSCGLLVMLMAIFFMGDKFFAFRRNAIDNITTLASVIGMNSTAALTFDDPDTAREILSALSADPKVADACIIRPNGRIFASYPYNADEDHHHQALVDRLLGQIRRSSDPEAKTFTFSGQHLILAQPIVLNYKQIGFIVIRADLHQLYSRIAIFGAMVLAGMVVLLLTAQLITGRLHRTISDPLLTLVSTMDRVTAEKNYTLRAKKRGNDELGVLIDGFNDMLARIQQRDQQLEEHGLQLEAQVAQRTRALIRSHEKLTLEMEERKQMQDQLTRAQRMEAVGTLASGVAHDLNNILSGIVSYPDLLLMRLPEGSDMRNPLITIQNSGIKAAAIVQDLLTLARRGVTTAEVVNLKTVVEDYLHSPEYEKLMSFHPGVRVMTAFDPDVLNIAGSPVHLGKTVMNLVANAAEAINEEGTIAISLGNQYIDTPVRGYDQVQQGDYAVLKVRDSGHGIAARDLERIFEPFYTKKKMGRSGTGLGMAVVWGTVKDHQGYIDVESREGIGTTFYLYFPVTRRQLLTQEPARIKDYQGNGQSILVVDDIQAQREIASDILQSLGYRVTAVDGGEAAIEHLKHQRADLLLLDMVMEPGIDGLETYERIVAGHSTQRAIIASGYSESERVKRAQALGAGPYLRKPYTIENLARAVHAELNREDVHVI